MSSPESRGVTSRAVVIGIVLMFANCYWIIGMEVVLGLGWVTIFSLFMNVVFSLFVLSLLNLPLRKFKEKLALSPAELMTVYVILSIATSLFSVSMMQILIPIMGYAFWHATPENDWAALFWRYLPSWLVVDNESVLRGYYEGESSLYSARIVRAWLVPALIWTSFIVVLMFMMLCINAIMRKQWTENEKLTYPVIQLPLEMTSNQSRLFSSRSMWIGFALAGGLDLVRGLHFLYPAVPAPKIGYDFAPLFTTKPWSAIGWTPVYFYPFVVGLAYFMPLDLSFSVWFFYLFWKFQAVFRVALGWQPVSGALGLPSDQSAGAWIGIGIGTLLLARKHLWEVLKGVLSTVSNPDDRADEEKRSEPMSYRTAILGLIGGMVFMAVFGYKAGMSVWVIWLFFFIYFILSISISKMRAELGPPVHDLYYAGPDRLIAEMYGTKRLGSANLAGFSLLFWLTRSYEHHPMPHQLEGFRIAQRTGMSPKRLSFAMMLAAGIASLAFFWMFLHFLYKHGSVLCHTHYLAWESYNRLHQWLYNPKGMNIEMVKEFSFGLVFTFFLMIMTRRFLWWHFHPVGYATAGTWTMSWMWFSVLISWLAKRLLLSYGGLRIYRRAVPFFAGLILGQYVVASIWTILGVIFSMPVYRFFA